jgi:acetyl-CoA carboxylase carboxyl transferase subunit beta
VSGGERRLSARDRLERVVDAGSLRQWDEDVLSNDPLGFVDSKPYLERLAAAAEAAGTSEAVVTGEATVDGRRVAVIAGEFGFLGGSIGVATGERVASAFDRAVESGLPVIALPASGGTRMQEGAIALTQMAKLAAAVRRLRRAGLPYLVLLTDPTTGGVLASWGGLGTVTYALPGALVGFGGPRVVEMLTGRAMPPGIQVSEHLAEVGLIDGVVELQGFRERVCALLRSWSGRDAGADADAGPPPPAEEVEVDAWQAVEAVRHPDRPVPRDVLAAWCTDLTILGGTAADDGCLLAIGRFDGVGAVIVAQDRRRDPHRAAVMGPAGYRRAQRGMALAAELGLPLVTLVDTPGAEMSAAAEEGGLAREIGLCLADMSEIPAPTVAVLLGEGGSGGALALLPADRVVCAGNGVLAPIAPEGASAILYRTTDRAPELAAKQGIAAPDLRRWGIVDVIVPEERPAHEDPARFVAAIGAAVSQELRALQAQPTPERLAARRRRYRALGSEALRGTEVRA